MAESDACPCLTRDRITHEGHCCLRPLTLYSPIECPCPTDANYDQENR